MENYTYQPLDATRKEFRLLILNPLPADATQAHVLDCRLRRAYFGDDGLPAYETVSYVWGDPTPCELLLVDGKSLRVPKNTEQTLRQFVFRNRGHRVLWIDAVCINQNDLTERSQQAQMMGEIYKNSTCNLINLGEEDRFLTRAISNLNSIMEEVRDDTDNFTRIRAVLMPNGGWIKASSSPKTTIDFDALIHFYSRPWFRRVWVVQEAMLASNNQCSCGGKDISFDTIILAAAWLYRYHFLHIPRRLYETVGLKNASSMLGHRLLRGNRSMSVGYALSFSSKLETSDARDKVFGMFGLLNIDRTLAVSGLIMPDYTKPTARVFCDAVRYTIEKSQILYILTSISHRSEDDIVAAGFPSWVPRLDRGQISKVDPNNLAVAYSRPFGTWRSHNDILEFDHEEQNVLNLPGIEVGTISNLSAAFSDENVTDFYRTIHDSVAHNASMKKHFAQTLTAETDYTGKRELGTSVLERQFERWLDHYQSTNQRLGAPQELLDDANDQLREATYFQKAMSNAMNSRRLANTESGPMALVPKMAREGDLVASFRGGLTPFVIRRLETGSHLLLGECYVEGYMDGEAFEEQVALGASDTIYRII